MRAERAVLRQVGRETVRVLVAEADAGNAGVLLDALALEGHVAVHASSALEARGLAAAGGWDVCVVDGFASHGAELADEDRDLYRVLAAAAPVVVTTARGWAADADPASLGVAAVVAKPYLLNELLLTLSIAGLGRSGAG
jgi:CheY-like chemotaxis protein